MRNILLRQAGITPSSSGMWEIKSHLQRLKGIRIMFIAFILVLMRNYLLQEALDKTITPLGCEKLKRKDLLRLKGHTDYVRSVHFSYDAKLLASGSLDKTIILWDVGNQKPLATLKGHTSYVFHSVHFSHDAK